LEGLGLAEAKKVVIDFLKLRRARPAAVRTVALALSGLLIAVAFGPTGAIPGRQASINAASPRLLKPEDRYAMAGGCYGVKALVTAAYLVRQDGGFIAGSPSPDDAEPFHFQATDLGKYLLYGTAKDFVAADEGVVGGLVSTVQNSQAGQIASGVTTGATDEVLNTVRDTLGPPTGLGGAIVAAGTASQYADWEIEQFADDVFTIKLPALDKFLAVGDGGALALVDAADENARFGFELAEGCAAFPEVDVNIGGPIAKGASPYEEVEGYLDAHVHMMAFEFIGGRVRCGRPWHPYGVAHALVDCPDHEPGGHGAVLEQVLTQTTPGSAHATDGWPTFSYWPRYNSLTHEQLYYKWLERAWRGGLRMFTNLLVDNHALCQIYPLKRNSCNEMDGVRLEAKRIRELERYIDAQSGGPGEGWFRIVTDPFQARSVINEGKLAVILGIEVSIVLDCGVTLDVPKCTEAQIDQRLDEVYDLGVRQMELVNKFDNALSGITGDGGTTGVVTSTGNFFETGSFFAMETCGPEDGEAQDKTQMNIHDDLGTPDALTGRDSLVAGIFEVSGRFKVAPLYPPAPHCNVRGLTPLGAHMIRRMIHKGIIFDPDHMSARARTQAMDIIREEKAPGVVSSHSWADITIYPRVLEAGGVVTPYAGGSKGFYETWAAYKKFADPRFTFGFGYGSDVNGFGAQGGPRTDAPVKVSYPFTAFGGAVVHQQRSGERVYDINVDGVAHYGLYPDWIEDLRLQGGDAIIQDMLRGSEAYLQMWERTIGIAPNACRSDVDDLTDAAIGALEDGMTPQKVLATVGQPHARHGNAFTFCLTEARTATVTFGAGDVVSAVAIA
jgi:hypothetical protein